MLWKTPIHQVSRYKANSQIKSWQDKFGEEEWQWLKPGNEWLLHSLNAWESAARHTVYMRRRNRMNAKTGRPYTRLLVEGDSWFCYPMVITDIVEHLNRAGFAVYTCAGAGHRVSSMADQRFQELNKPLISEKVSAVLLSGGGNDLLALRNSVLGRTSRKAIFKSAECIDDPEDYINQEAMQLLFQQIRGGFQRLHAHIRQHHLLLPIFVNGYAQFPIFPDSGKYFWEPIQFAQSGGQPTVTIEMCRKIIQVFLNQLYEIIENVFGPDENSIIIDNRDMLLNFNGLPDVSLWYDETHPNSIGFKLITDRIQKVLRVNGIQV